MLQPEATAVEPALARCTAGIAGVGCALPATTLATSDIAARIGVEPEWIIRRTGIGTRRRAGADDSVVSLAVAAGREALLDAGIDGGDLDAVILTTSAGDRVMPAGAPKVAHELGAVAAMAWDVSLACTGYLAVLQQGAALIESGRADNILVVASEVLSRITDHDDRKTAALFGDAAGAAVLTAGGPLRLGATVMRADGDGIDDLYVDNDERLIRMDGPAVFQRAVASMEARCREVLDLAGVTIDDVALIVPHQANARITLALRERFGLEPERVVDVIADRGNTGAATIPLALAEIDLPDEGLILLTAFGAGFASGAMLLEAV